MTNQLLIELEAAQDRIAQLLRYIEEFNLPISPPPVVEKVKGCSGCPFPYLYPHGDIYGCSHPKGNFPNITVFMTRAGQSMPENCPLRTAPLLIMAEGK